MSEACPCQWPTKTGQWLSIQFSRLFAPYALLWITSFWQTREWSSTQSARQPASRPASLPASQPASHQASRPASKPTIKQVSSQPASQQASQQASQPASHQASRPASKPASKASQHASRPASQAASQQAGARTALGRLAVGASNAIKRSSFIQFGLGLIKNTIKINVLLIMDVPGGLSVAENQKNMQ